MGISYRKVSHCEKRRVVITQLWSLQLHLSGLLRVEQRLDHCEKGRVVIKG